MKENEIEIVEIIEEDKEGHGDMLPQKNITVSQLLQKNNELLEYHNNILLENKKTTNINSMANIFFKLVLVAAAAIFSFFLYKIYEEIVISNQKEMQIVNNLPAQEAPIVNVSVPETNVAITNHAVLDKVSFFKGGYYGFVYKNTSQNIIYCRTKESEAVHDAILSPNSIVELVSPIESCRDAVLVEIRDPSKPIDHKMPHQDLFKI
ncbi:MAG: hypothetical protein ACI9TV_000390 [Sulfurimonas sp.]|uniref:hypothetical protein n=1 Tax=Sulfurimonas sp. TaxID=2022749 RepID=UPI0039E30A2A